jgi:hypothetical protein
MPFVTRDQDGQVVAVAELPLEDDAEHLPPDHPEIAAFVERACTLAEGEVSSGPFFSADIAFIRVVEDLIEVLIRKGVLAVSDLPGPAQDKLMERRALRGWLAGVAGIVDDGEGKII